MHLTWRHWAGGAVCSLIAGVATARLLHAPTPPSAAVAQAEERLTRLPAVVAAGPVPGQACPPVEAHDVVPSIELDDLQGVSADWRFLIDENTEALRKSHDQHAAEAFTAAKYLVIFAAPQGAKRLPAEGAGGEFSGSMVLVDPVAGSMLCQQPLVVLAPGPSFREAFRREALVVAQQLGVRVGLPHCH